MSHTSGSNFGSAGGAQPERQFLPNVDGLEKLSQVVPESPRIKGLTAEEIAEEQKRAEFMITNIRNLLADAENLNDVDFAKLDAEWTEEYSDIIREAEEDPEFNIQRLMIDPDAFKDIFKDVELPDQDPKLQWQIQNYSRNYYELYPENYPHRSRSTQETLQELSMFEFKLTNFTYSRDLRTEEIKSPEVQETIEVKKNLHPYGIPKFMVCVDGRVLPKLIGGYHGNAIRSLAGDTIELTYGDEDEMYLREGHLTEVIDKSLATQDVLCEVLDSHVGCAARNLHANKAAGKTKIPSSAEWAMMEILNKLEDQDILPAEEREKKALLQGELEARKGLADGGLSVDVERKSKLANAITKYVDIKYGGAKRIVPIQTSFDPHDGYLYMGLEKPECLDDPRTKVKGYDKDTRDALVQEGKIISTKALVANNSELRSLLRENYFPVDYEKNYIESTKTFWTNIKDMSEVALPVLEREIVGVFPELAPDDKKDDLRQRSTLLFANLYTGYLLNHDANDEPMQYRYHKHIESIIAVTVSEKGPFDRAGSFSVNPNNPDLYNQLLLARGIILQNRELGEMSSLEQAAVQKIYDGEPEGYVNAPVTAVLFERMDVMPTPELLGEIRDIDWSFIKDSDWAAMDEAPFLKLLNEHYNNIPALVASTIEKLRQRAIEFYTQAEQTDEAYVLFKGQLVPVWTLSGPNRETITYLPFIMNKHKLASANGKK